LEEMTPQNVGARFVAVYASEMAWRKQHGITAAELARQIDKHPVQVKVNVTVKPPS